jgi:hypothetical protein
MSSSSAMRACVTRRSRRVRLRRGITKILCDGLGSIVMLREQSQKIYILTYLQRVVSTL